jgi:hypothetical protein
MGKKTRTRIRSKKLIPLEVLNNDTPKYKPIPLETKVSLELNNGFKLNNQEYKTPMVSRINEGKYEPNKPYLQLLNFGRGQGMVGAFPSHYSVNTFPFQGNVSSMFYSKQSMFGFNAL